MKRSSNEIQGHGIGVLCEISMQFKFKDLLPIVVNFSWFLSVYKKGVVLIFNTHLIFFFFLGGPKKSSSTYLSYKATDIVHVSNFDFPIEILFFFFFLFYLATFSNFTSQNMEKSKT